MATSWDIDTLARTVWGEARGGGLTAMQDIACVVLNRYRDGWQKSVTGVCRAPNQFSCWDTRDPNYRKLLGITTRDPVFALAREAAEAACDGALTDHTEGADSYFATSIRSPYWAVPPAHHTVTRWLHSFWIVRPGRAPTHGIGSGIVIGAEAPDAGSDVTADLNAGELAAVASGV